jgi:hypothetical protein
MRLQPDCLPAAGDEPPFRASRACRARPLVRTRRAWIGHRHTALQFLAIAGLGPRSLERSLAMVLGAARSSKGSR